MLIVSSPAVRCLVGVGTCARGDSKFDASVLAQSQPVLGCARDVHMSSIDTVHISECIYIGERED